MSEKLLDIKDLSVWYKTYRGYAQVVDNVSFFVEKGEKVGLVGESGCGKTTTMKAILRLQEDGNASVQPGASIQFDGEDVLGMKKHALLELRRKKISMISQSPMAALNPVFTIGQQMLDVIKYSGYFDKKDRAGMMEAARQAITSVMISDPDRILKSYPYQLSGGMLQRCMIAVALLQRPDIIIADEPTTALDSMNQREVVAQFHWIRERFGSSLILVSHDLGVVRQLAQEVLVMKDGVGVEYGGAELFSAPRHPYTRYLVDTRAALSKAFERVMRCR